MRLVSVFFFLLSFIVTTVAETTPEQHRSERLEKFPVIERARLMVENELLPQGGLDNPDVIDVMKRVPRHRFISPLHQSIAYRDQAIPIGNAQTISPPYVVAFMTQTLDPKPGDKVLEIGTGSGYQAAVLSFLVDEVYSIEIVEPLGNRARRLLDRLGMDNVHVKVGDGYKGWPEAAPFDSIIVTCSPESVPTPLVEQLREGGRMIIPLGERFQQAFYLCKKVDGKLEKEYLTQALFVPMTGEAEERREVLPDAKNPSIIGGDFSQIRENGSPIGWHYARNTKILTETSKGNNASDEVFIAQFTSRGPDPLTRIEIDKRKKSTSHAPNVPEPQQFAQILQGFAVDGREVSQLKIEYRIRGENIVSLGGGFQTQTGVVWLYDEDRNQISEILIGRCSGSFDWKTVSETLVIPQKTREAILLIGLPVASGRLDVRNVVLGR